jgi:hypothetical protein
MGKILQLARLQNTVDTGRPRAGDLPAEKVRHVELDVMEVPAGTPPLLGFVPPGALDLHPNPEQGQLEDNPEFDGKFVTYLL